MANVIAVIWDFDRTLVDGYMQDPLFARYNVDAGQFWKEVNALPEYYRQTQGVEVNKDTIYLNCFIHEARPGGKFEGLNNKILRESGGELNFYPGVPEIFDSTRSVIGNNKSFAERGIRVEHYIVSTGMAEVIRGSAVSEHVDHIWGCELIETRNASGNPVIGELGYTIDNTSKTRALFEINKGVPVEEGIDVNARVPKNLRRVRFENMIYIADGPSDVPAFSVVKHYGGSTFAVYPKGNEEAFAQVEQLREDGRIDMYAEADYSTGTTANMWITHKVTEIAQRIVSEEKQRLESAVSTAPKHLT